MRQSFPDAGNRAACSTRRSCIIPAIIIALLMPAAAAIASDEDTGSGAQRGANSWGSAPCEGIALDNFGACPEELVGAQTCCGLGVCASTGQFQCGNGQLEDTCTPGTPDSSEDTSCDGIDQDCSGEPDEDYTSQNTSCGTGQCSTTGQTLCEDGTVIDTCEPGEPDTESCNGLDDDCDGSVDEGLGGGATSCGAGACSSDGQLLCKNGAFIDTCEPGDPEPELCNGIDDDCDGSVDEGLGGGATSCGTGACSSDGQLLCKNGAFIDTCEPGDPEPELCNGIDDDCDGSVDEGLGGGATSCGTGACSSDGQLLCKNGAFVDTCEPGSPEPEVCNGIDDDCDGQVDEGC